MNRCYICPFQQLYIYKEVLIQQLRVEKMKPPKILEFSFIILVGISVFVLLYYCLRYLAL